MENNLDNLTNVYVLSICEFNIFEDYNMLIKAKVNKIEDDEIFIEHEDFCELEADNIIWFNKDDLIEISSEDTDEINEIYDTLVSGFFNSDMLYIKDFEVAKIIAEKLIDLTSSMAEKLKKEIKELG
jgi:hypothetical protein